MATKSELLELIADAVGVSVSDIKVLKADFDTGSIRLEIDSLDLDPDEDEEDEDINDLDDSDDE